VKQALERVKVDYAFESADDATLEAMMKRRHWIAHRADPNPMSGPGHHNVQPIGRILVDKWVTTVETFGKAVLAKL
jgi:hypothetical protein